MFFHLTFMGGSEVRLKGADNVIVTMWGGTDILMPTFAEKIIRIRKCLQEYGEVNDSAVRQTNIITLMGGTVYRWPTLGREIEEMTQLKESGVVTDDELFRLWDEALRRDDLDMFETITVMGGCGEEYPDLKEEMKALERLISRGVLSPDDVAQLKGLLQESKPADRKTEEVQEKLRRLLFPTTTQAGALPGSAVDDSRPTTALLRTQ